MLYDPGRWAHINFRLLHFLKFLFSVWRSTLSQIYPDWNSRLNTKLRLEFQVELLIHWENVGRNVEVYIFF